MISSVERCSRCRRNFGGLFTFRRAHPDKRCRSARELRNLAITPNRADIWTRPDPTGYIQLRLFAGRRGRPSKSRPPAIFSGALRGQRGRVWPLGREALLRPLRGQLRLFRLPPIHAAEAA